MTSFSMAYQAKDSLGSCLTAPLRVYNDSFQDKIQGSATTYERTMWKCCHFISNLFIFPILGALALVGICINLCCVTDWPLNRATERFCEVIEEHFYNAQNVAAGASAYKIDDLKYAYHLNRELILQKDERQTCDLIRKWTKKYNWFPEVVQTFWHNKKVTVHIAIPDQMPETSYRDMLKESV